MKLSNGKEITDSLSLTYIDGGAEAYGSYPDDLIKAWAYAIRTNMAFELGGWYKKMAEGFIKKRLISKSGEINWKLISKRIEEQGG